MVGNNNRQAGFSLIEVTIGILLIVIGLGIGISLYYKSSLIHQRNERNVQVRRELDYALLKIRQMLTLAPGHNLGVYTGLNFAVADLPANGSTIVNNKNTAIRLGIVTPYRINGHDALATIYGRHDVPRLELVEATTSTGNIGVARVSTPDIAESGAGSTEVTNLLGKLNAGDLLMLAGAPDTSVGAAVVDQVVGRVVRLLAKPQVVVAGNPQRQLIELVFDYCDAACSSTFPQLLNQSSNRSFGIGSTLSPIAISSIYLKAETGRSVVVRNDGGTITAGVGGTMIVSGGRESILGESDYLKVSYQLDDGSVMSTPGSPAVPWLHRVDAVSIELSRSIPSPFKGETISSTVNTAFPLKLKTLE